MWSRKGLSQSKTWKVFFYWNGERSTCDGWTVFQLKNESSIQGGVLSNPKKKKRWNVVFMCRHEIIQHNFEVGQYNKAFYQTEEDPPMQG